MSGYATATRRPSGEKVGALDAALRSGRSETDAPGAEIDDREPGAPDNVVPGARVEHGEPDEREGPAVGLNAKNSGSTIWSFTATLPNVVGTSATALPVRASQTFNAPFAYVATLRPSGLTAMPTDGPRIAVGWGPVATVPSVLPLRAS